MVLDTCVLVKMVKIDSSKFDAGHTPFTFLLECFFRLTLKIVLNFILSLFIRQLKNYSTAVVFSMTNWG